MNFKKVTLFAAAVFLILCLNMAGLYASAQAPEPGVGNQVDATANNAVEFSASIHAAVKEAKDVVRIRINQYDKGSYDINSTVNKILSDNVDLFFVKSWTADWMQDKGKKSGIMTISIQYMYPKDKIILMKNELSSKIDSIFNKAINIDMDENTKELMLHDYLAMNTKVSTGKPVLDQSLQDQLESLGLKMEESLINSKTDNELSTPYSVLVEGEGNSAGCARAMKLLCDKAGIECIVVYGENGTWNMVKIEGDYYHLDVSEDKIKNNEGVEVLTHDYFNVSDIEMSKYYKWDKSKYPLCTSSKCNYFHKNKTIVNNIDEFKDRVKNAVEKAADNISIRVTNFDNKVYSISDTIDAVLRENPQLEDIKEWLWVENRSVGTVNVIFKYDFPKDKVLAMRQETEKKADEIISSIIRPNMGDYDKVLAVHDYIVKSSVYDEENADKDTVPPEEYDAYGVLIKGIGVCDGYTEAMKLLLDKAGIKCIIVDGSVQDRSSDNKVISIGHSWNIVKIEDSYYHIDITWDDGSSEGRCKEAAYIYFNVTDEEIRKSHTWDVKKYPSCTSTKYNYFYKNKLVAEDYNKACDKIKSALNGRRKELVIKIAGFDSAGYDIEEMIKKAFYRTSLRRLNGAEWIVYDEVGIIDIKFEY